MDIRSLTNNDEPQPVVAKRVAAKPSNKSKKRKMDDDTDDDSDGKYERKQF